MTIPMTAIGICEYSGRPKISSMAPYFMQTFWNAAIERTSAICAMKLVMPSGRKRL